MEEFVEDVLKSQYLWVTVADIMDDESCLTPGPY